MITALCDSLFYFSVIQNRSGVICTYIFIHRVLFFIDLCLQNRKYPSNYPQVVQILIGVERYNPLEMLLEALMERMSWCFESRKLQLLLFQSSDYCKSTESVFVCYISVCL